MGGVAPLTFDGSPPEAGPDDAPPEVFLRTFVTPPGAPWTQARAAALEVRHGAPLPLGDLMHRVKRLEGWGPGRPARFAAFYIRRRDYRRPFETLVDVDGAPVRVAFGARAQHFGRLRSLALAGAAAALSVGLVASGTVAALNARAEVAGRLDTAARQIAVRLSQGRETAGRLETSRAIAQVQGHAGLPAEVLDDLEWLAHARTPEAQILAVHWDHGLLAVEARGEAAPVAATDREVVRAPRPLRAGVWLWGIRRRPVGAGSEGTAP
jgi:hypothetical protein